MKRRAFLRMIGLAPVAAALPAMALPRPDNVKGVVTGEAGPEMVINVETTKPLVVKDGKLFMNPAYSNVPMYDPRVHDYKSWQAGNGRPK